MMAFPIPEMTKVQQDAWRAALVRMHALELAVAKGDPFDNQLRWLRELIVTMSDVHDRDYNSRKDRHG